MTQFSVVPKFTCVETDGENVVSTYVIPVTDFYYGPQYFFFLTWQSQTPDTGLGMGT